MTPVAGWITLTLASPLRFDASCATTETVTVPRLSPVTRPFSSTVATLFPELRKVTSRFVTSSGYRAHSS